MTVCRKQSIACFFTICWYHKHTWIDLSCIETAHYVISYQRSQCKSSWYLSGIFSCVIFVLRILWALPKIEWFSINCWLSNVSKVQCLQEVSLWCLLLRIMTANTFLRTKKKHSFICVQFYTFSLLSKLIEAFRIYAIIIFCSEQLLCIIIPYFCSRIKFSRIPCNVIRLWEVFRPEWCLFLCIWKGDGYC